MVYSLRFWLNFPSPEESTGLTCTRVLVPPAILSDLFVFHPGNATWAEIEGPLPPGARTGHQIAGLGGLLYFLGGRSGDGNYGLIYPGV